MSNSRTPTAKIVVGLEQAELDATSPLRWCCLDVDGNVIDSGISQLGRISAELPALKSVHDISVLAFGSFVRLCHVQLPTRNPRQVRQALPYAVEELIADNIEHVHLALPHPLPAQGAIPVAVIRHQVLIGWLDALYQHGIVPLRLSPGVLTLPWQPGQLVVMAWQDQLMVRSERYFGQTLALEHAPLVLPPLLNGLNDSGAPPVLQVLGGEGADAQALCSQLAPLAGGEVAQRVYRETPFEICAIGAADASGNINLLQGGYKVARESEQQRRRLRLGIGLAAASLAVFVLLSGLSGYWFHQRADALQSASVNQYRRWFPDEVRVVSPRRQLQSKLSSGASEVDNALFPLLDSLALGSAGNPLVRVNSLRFRAEERQLQLEVQGPSLDALEEFRHQLQAQQLTVNLTSAIDEGNIAIARMELSHEG
ncbi:MAG TPA: type II secretion system protein GspL [Spongiibacteraceae bacterium]|nr:type II secretion system protein GspL [Spongiibacteraceae bacterium]